MPRHAFHTNFAQRKDCNSVGSPASIINFTHDISRMTARQTFMGFGMAIDEGLFTYENVAAAQDHCVLCS